MAYSNNNKFKKHSTLKVSDESNQILTAVALQDHWARTLSLGATIGPRKIGLGKAARAKSKVVPRSIIDTGRNRVWKKSKPEDSPKEYVLDEKLPPLTLAQKYGLVHAPNPLLSEHEWTEIKVKSNQRDDSGEPCVICKEDFGLQEQVLLSCTHVFHRACLQAFERFTGKKTCPMCRHEQYQTRVIHEGARLHRHKCAIRIQSQWRGYVVRCWYKKLRETVPPKDPNLRKKFYEDKMTSIVDRMIKSLDVNVNQFLQEIETNVRQCRAVFNQWDVSQTVLQPHEWDDIQLKAVMRGVTDCPICLTELHLTETMCDHNPDPSLDLNLDPNPISEGHRESDISNQNRQERRKNKDKLLLEKLSPGKPAVYKVLPGIPEKGKAKSKKIEKVLPSSVNEIEEKPVKKREARATALLSCSHVFHATCLATLEDMAMVDKKYSCPVCRAQYQKKIISI